MDRNFAIYIALTVLCGYTGAQIPDGFWGFNTQVATEGQEVRLDCNWTYIDGEEDMLLLGWNFTVVQWVTPNFTVINENTQDDHLILMDDTQYQNFYLNITSVWREDTGTYHCMINRTNGLEWNWGMIKKGVNMRGPYFIPDSWEEFYKTPFWIGFGSTVGFLLIVAGVFLVYHYSWIAPEGWYGENDSRDSSMDVIMGASTDPVDKKGHVNEGYYQDLEKNPKTSDVGVHQEMNKDSLYQEITKDSPPSYNGSGDGARMRTHSNLTDDETTSM